ncbi:ATP-binding protein [Cryptosporangium minutisporangium]|uniref:Orc1-like AAA ATPase domain-containing protein n=1 Tax=Cryptosporangium minutisporangium TaxID=113569 RepID=A0ABP6T493_9ACTN
MRRAFVLVALTLASAATSVLLAVAVNVATGGELPGRLAPLEPFAWPAVAVAALVTAVLAYWQQRPVAEPSTAVTQPASPPDSATPPHHRPAELPAMPALFTGRADELDRILAAVEDGAPVIAVSGPAGVGKSALALHVAHRISDRYPDGALFVRLRGASSEPAEPGDVLGRLLRSLPDTPGADDGELRGDTETLAARFRTRIAGRQFLIVLDDARSAAQVRPLLPGTPGSLVLVTSRPVLAELAAATLVRLGVFSATEARELLARVAGANRVNADPQATAAVLRACGNLPLAVGIAGSRLRARPSWTMATLAERLADEGRRLDELSTGHDAVRASVGATYTELDEHHQRVFRRLGAHPGTDFDTAAAAALADLLPAGAEPTLDRLVERQLVEVVTSDRYRLHDLLRLYAAEQLGAAQGRPLGPEGLAALRRLARHYTQRAAPAPPGPPEPEPGYPEGLDERRAFVDAERENIVATVTAAVAAGEHLRSVAPDASADGVETVPASELFDAAWELAAAVEPHFAHYPFHADGRRLWTAGLAAATAVGQPDCIARAEYALARATQYSGDIRRGLAHARHSLEWWERTEDLPNTAAAHRRLASALHGAGRLAEAEEHYARTLQLCLEATPEVWSAGEAAGLRASALRGLGSLQLARGEVDAAVRTLQRAVDARRDAGDDAGLARARTSLARAHRKAGRTEVARELVAPQVPVFRRLGDAMWEVTALRELGRLELTDGRLAEAAGWLESARAVAERSRNHTGAGITLVALAEVDVAAGRPAAAVDRFREAIAGFRAVDAHVREGLALLRLALLLAYHGAHAEADAAVARAEELLADTDLAEAGEMLERVRQLRGATRSDLGG